MNTNDYKAYWGDNGIVKDPEASSSDTQNNLLERIREKLEEYPVIRSVVLVVFAALVSASVVTAVDEKNPPTPTGNGDTPGITVTPTPTPDVNDVLDTYTKNTKGRLRTIMDENERELEIQEAAMMSNAARQEAQDLTRIELLNEARLATLPKFADPEVQERIYSKYFEYVNGDPLAYSALYDFESDSFDTIEKAKMGTTSFKNFIENFMDFTVYDGDDASINGAIKMKGPHEIILTANTFLGYNYFLRGVAQHFEGVSGPEYTYLEINDQGYAILYTAENGNLSNLDGFDLSIQPDLVDYYHSVLTNPQDPDFELLWPRFLADIDTVTDSSTFFNSDLTPETITEADIERYLTFIGNNSSFVLAHAR